MADFKRIERLGPWGYGVGVAMVGSRRERKEKAKYSRNAD
jgi:hypothetical protein